MALMLYNLSFGEKPTTLEIQLKTASTGPFPDPLISLASPLNSSSSEATCLELVPDIMLKLSNLSVFI